MTKPLDGFGKDRAKPSGRMSHCRDCCNRARKERYDASLDRERQRSRQYYADNREAVRARYDPAKAAKYAREWRARNPEKAREKDRMKSGRVSLKRHDGPEERARLWALQDGCCYMCRRPFMEDEVVVVDHDHDCCPTGSRTDSCHYCRRGLAHAKCNQRVGLAGEDMDLLRAIIVNFEPVQRVTKERIANAQVEQPTLMDAV